MLNEGALRRRGRVGEGTFVSIGGWRHDGQIIKRIRPGHARG